MNFLKNGIVERRRMTNGYNFIFDKRELMEYLGIVEPVEPVEHHRRVEDESDSDDDNDDDI